ncbi:MAG: molecular chaperone HtpG, partial [Oscillospiraceae bacterium]
MAKKQFKAESKRLLELMIHSIYTHKEIFLRELISNASDASDKRYFSALANEEGGLSRDALAILLTVDKDARTLTISDKGCGMTREELEQNLGTIAHSGSLAFKQENAEASKEELDLIGQFGVGFYSSFMVSEQVVVRTLSQQSGEALEWRSDGTDGYVIASCDKTEVGTDVILTLLPDSEEEKYSEFLEEHRLSGLVRRYSDYIRYPIKMEMTHSHKKEDSPEDKPEFEQVTELETLNSMTPIWKKNRSEVTDEELSRFYQDKFSDYENPLRVIRTSTEGTATYSALLFVPAHAPYNYYNKDYEPGLQLYASGVLIMDRCADLLPEHFSFVRGLVDSQDLSLNISREMLQHDRQLKVIASRLEKKIKSELKAMQEQNREDYEAFFKAFGLQLKYGLYSGYGQNKDLLADLLLYPSSTEHKKVTLAEYVSRMKEEQKYIYYACGENEAQLSHLPQTELLTDKGYEILYMTDNVDEFAVKMMHDFDGKEFRSVADGDLGLESEDDKESLKQLTEENSGLLSFLTDTLGSKIGSAKLTNR